jgi:hypothetical protein
MVTWQYASGRTSFAGRPVGRGIFGGSQHTTLEMIIGLPREDCGSVVISRFLGTAHGIAARNDEVDGEPLRLGGVLASGRVDGVG